MLGEQRPGKQQFAKCTGSNKGKVGYYRAFAAALEEEALARGCSPMEAAAQLDEERLAGGSKGNRVATVIKQMATAHGARKKAAAARAEAEG